MLTQIYEVSGPEEARAVAMIGVDHIGAKVGSGQFPRELSVAAAAEIIAAIPPPSKFSALFLSSDIDRIETWTRELRPAIVHLGARPEMLSPADLLALKRKLPESLMMRSIPVSGEDSLAVARSYDGIADILMLDSIRQADNKVGALGITHDWSLSRRIVELVSIPVFLAGGLGPDNVAEAIRLVRPAGVDSKTRTDREGTHAKDLERVRRYHEAARAAG
ncbi:phosphoribosylanthranilate isomerase [Mesorhizobium sp. M0488]|uniref:phosphoribosylanthranilate isomerase n=1 Tax=unclassified Mesorhizobium TaxID=325217 RepID=UPI0033384CA2